MHTNNDDNGDNLMLFCLYFLIFVRATHDYLLPSGQNRRKGSL